MSRNFRAFFASRTFEQEVNHQKERLRNEFNYDTHIHDDTTGLFQHRPYKSQNVTLINVNAGRDVKLPLDIPTLLLDGVAINTATTDEQAATAAIVKAKKDWKDFAVETNKRLRPYRANKIDNAIMAGSGVLPPLLFLLITRERKRMVKIKAVLEACCWQFNHIWKNTWNDLNAELYFNSRQARSNINTALSVRVEIPTQAQAVAEPGDNAPVNVNYRGETVVPAVAVPPATPATTDALAASSTENSVGKEEIVAFLSIPTIALNGPTGKKLANSLVREGFDTLERLAAAQFDDLVAVGVKRGWARAIYNELQHRRQQQKLPQEALQEQEQHQGQQQRQQRKSSNPFDSPRNLTNKQQAEEDLLKF